MDIIKSDIPVYGSKVSRDNKSPFCERGFDCEDGRSLTCVLHSGAFEIFLLGFERCQKTKIG